MTALCTPNRTIPVSDGDMNAFVARPEGRPLGSVLIMVELWGLTNHMAEVCERLAGEGYAAVALDLFRGESPPVPSDPTEKWARTFEAFDDVRANRDCRHAAQWLMSGRAGFDAGAIVAWGFCMGGRFAHNLGAFEPRLAGVINFYGRINFPRMANKPFLPVEITPMIACPYLGAFAESDPLIPPADLAALRAGLADNPDHLIEQYEGADHAFFNDQRDTYHPEAAARAWTQVLNFLQRLN
jgi:carboxymethylenebutenolidase